ncbi:AbiJ-related protein [Actinoplanes siamensis]|uniref:AbiJ-NTD3 domain-containing protein n=1 Tax=Actinoplanes siamensis TaxID=1223317 RepID=A0A919TPG1_9ACTN|nr:hypothetical protein [Actinoplanes siamensis]GIF08860.1 hypothetical protein Asi03nite_63980 [Actinoplanes siamensis]
MTSSPKPPPTATGRITHVTRRRLIEGFAEMPTAHWSGDLDEVDFLARLYPLEEMPSTDSRREYGTAAADIWQHRVNNPSDWPDNWIFTDERFGLADNDEALLAFLVEMLHPEVRTHLAEVEQLRDFLNSVLVHDGYEIVQVDAISGAPIFDYRLIGSGVRGSMKNLIFAAVGHKPEIVLDDALNNDLRIVRNAENCLVYDRTLGSRGLTWADLTDWWAEQQGTAGAPTRELFLSLCQRLDRSLANDAERRIMRTYIDRSLRLGPTIPALIPQVYLHYDPRTASQRRTPGPLPRQRMDFLLLLPGRARVVIECDGKQHYADDNGHADPRRYAEMVAEDRELRLKGYEVYRFGGAELTNDRAAERLLSAFFDRLDQRHKS